MKKRIFALLLALALVLSLAACGKKDKDDGSSSGGEDTSASGGTEDTGASGGTGDSASGDGYNEGAIGQAMHTYWFDFTLTSAYVCQEFSGYTAGEGKRLLVAGLTVASTCDFPVDMYQSDFRLEWDSEDGAKYTTAVSSTSFEDKTVFSDLYALGAGKTKEGVLVYEVPSAESLDYYLTFVEVFAGESGSREGDTFVVPFMAAKQSPTA